MATPTRIYIVRAEGGAKRIVRAPNTAQAIRHVAADTLRAAVATQDELVTLVAAGTKVEDSGREAAEEA